MENTAEKTKIENPTFGQKAVGINFIPSNENAVDRCKQNYANIIDGLHEMRFSTAENVPRIISGDKARYIATAITLAEGAQMAAVKAITWKD